VTNWTTKRAQVNAALPRASGPLLTLGNQILSQLDSVGPAYDAAVVHADSSVATMMSVIEAQRVAALAARATVISDASLGAQTAEAQQAASTSPPSYVHKGIILAPSFGIPATTSEEPLVNASVTLPCGTRIESAIPGELGNEVQVRVVVHSPTYAMAEAEFRGFTEARFLGAPGRLLGSVSNVAQTIIGTDWTYMSGGTGGSEAALRARLADAQTLPAVTPGVRALLADALQNLKVPSVPALPTPSVDSRVVAELERLLARADVWLAAV
jgi:hypothetical protein